MEQRQFKPGWTVKGILGACFAPMGLLFLLLGFLLRDSDSVREQGPQAPVIFLAVFGGFGAVFLLIGLVLLGLDLRRRMRLRSAFLGGNCVDAAIRGVVTLRNVNMGNTHPCVVECAHTDSSGAVHVYRSRYLYKDVSSLLQSPTVPVWVDRFDESVGYVDIDAVLPETRA